MNLLIDNISSEILESKIHLFYNFFNSLVNNLNLTGKNLKTFAINDFENFFNEIIDSVFNGTFDKLLEDNINENKENMILKFTKNPSNYLYGKIKEDINKKFMEIMNKENIYELNNDFNDKIKELSQNFIDEIKKINEELFNAEFQKLKDANNKKVTTEFVNLRKVNSNNISSIEKILSKKEFRIITNKQLSEDEVNNLSLIQTEISKYKKYGLKEIEKGKLIYYTLSYDFTKIKDIQYNLLYMNKVVETVLESHKGNIYIIHDKNDDDEFKNSFEIKFIEDEEEVHEDIEEHKYEDEFNRQPEEGDINEEKEYQEDEVLNEVEHDIRIKKEKAAKKKDVKDKTEKEKVEKEKAEKEKAKKNLKIEDYIKSNKCKKTVIWKFKIENEEEIKNSIEKNMKVPTERDVKNHPEILLSEYKVNEFSNFVEKLIKTSISLYEIFSNIKDKK